ncbi:MAG: hypothetical protein Q8R47_06640 [Nanoarchaeota archaeon]|nr:hypothetical protein [Nanoarchaeota archaeon]
MTKDIKEMEADIPVDLDSINADPLDYLKSVVEDMQNNQYRGYNAGQIKGLELSVDLACHKLPEAAQLYAMNERIMISFGIADLKKEKGYVTVSAYDNEPETKR